MQNILDAAEHIAAVIKGPPARRVVTVRALPDS